MQHLRSIADRDAIIGTAAAEVDRLARNEYSYGGIRCASNAIPWKRSLLYSSPLRPIPISLNTIFSISNPLIKRLMISIVSLVVAINRTIVRSRGKHAT
jgi:hypothetical protein